MNGITILQGDVREVLKTLPDESVHCVVTSPPYWGLRDYGCDGQIGLETSPYEYIDKMVGVFREVRRTLRADGTLWMNMGDSYASDPGKGGSGTFNGRNGYGEDYAREKRNGAGRADGIVDERGQRNRDGVPKSHGLKAKDLCGVPWRLALALQADGWYLRSDIIWHKPNPMPESVTDRPTKSHEYIFLLSKSERYYYDAEAIKEESICGDPRKPYAPGQVDARGNGHDRNGGKIRESVKRGGFNGKTNALKGRESFRAVEDWRNKRSVWTVATQPFPEAHFATFPEELIKPCILAGCPDKCCGKCSAPWRSLGPTCDCYFKGSLTPEEKLRIGRQKGWIKPGTVLDPFGGSGTTALVARANGCKAILIELNPEYIKIAERRLRQNTLEFEEAVHA